MKIKELINYGKKILNENNVKDANLISRILAEYVLKIDRVQLLINENVEVEEKDKHRYYLSLIEIIQGIPVQYITNNQEFMKLNFYVDENVLIPQPDTEILVEEVIKIAKKYNKYINILDICTGSGCIGISIAENLENAKIVMSDVSKKALEIAKKNYNNILNKKTATFIESNMFEKIKGKFDVIVSNPPYIETNVIKSLDKQVQNEPVLALDGGKDGLTFYRILINEGYKHLKTNGYLCMEIGYNQKEKVIQILNQSERYTDIHCIKDLDNNDRVIIAKLK